MTCLFSFIVSCVQNNFHFYFSANVNGMSKNIFLVSMVRESVKLLKPLQHMHHPVLFRRRPWPQKESSVALLLCKLTFSTFWSLSGWHLETQTCMFPTIKVIWSLLQWHINNRAYQISSTSFFDYNAIRHYLKLIVSLLENIHFAGLTFHITQIKPRGPLCMHAWSIAGCRCLGNLPVRSQRGEAATVLHTSAAVWKQHCSPELAWTRAGAVWCVTQERSSCPMPHSSGRDFGLAIWSTTMHPPVLCLWECRALMLQDLLDWGK